MTRRRRANRLPRRARWARARPILLVAVLALAGLACTPAWASDGSGVCGFLHARVPYSTRAGGPAWRVYVRGQISCGAGTEALAAIMHRRGHNHGNGSEANSYFTYRGWTCPYGQMGSQFCFMGSARKPRARALALRCSEVQCPSAAPPAYLSQRETPVATNAENGARYTALSISIASSLL